MIRFSCIANTMAADGLVMEEAMASAVMLLAIFWNTSASAG